MLNIVGSCLLLSVVSSFPRTSTHPAHGARSTVFRSQWLDMTGRWHAEVEHLRLLGEQDEVPDSFVPFALTDDDKNLDSETDVKSETVDVQCGRPPTAV